MLDDDTRQELNEKALNRMIKSMEARTSLGDRYIPPLESEQRSPFDYESPSPGWDLFRPLN